MGDGSMAWSGTTSSGEAGRFDAIGGGKGASLLGPIHMRWDGRIGMAGPSTDYMLDSVDGE